MLPKTTFFQTILCGTKHNHYSDSISKNSLHTAGLAVAHQMLHKLLFISVVLTEEADMQCQI